MVRLDGEMNTTQNIYSEVLDGGNHRKAFKLTFAVGTLSWLQLTAVEGGGVFFTISEITQDRANGYTEGMCL